MKLLQLTASKSRMKPVCFLLIVHFLDVFALSDELFLEGFACKADVLSVLAEPE